MVMGVRVTKVRVTGVRVRGRQRGRGKGESESEGKRNNGHSKAGKCMNKARVTVIVFFT
jgi:hypothetical protein